MEFLALVLVNLALTVYLVEKGTKFWKEKRRHERLVNQHPEMKGVHPDEDGLFVFESDDSLKVLVLERMISPALMNPSTSKKRISKRTESLGAGMERRVHHPGSA